MYNGTTLINEGQIIAETPHSGSPETRDGSIIDHYFTINSGQVPSGKILNRGLVEARNNDRFRIRSYVPFINEGTFRAADSGVIQPTPR
jgi:hypothetical protein